MRTSRSRAVRSAVARAIPFTRTGAAVMLRRTVICGNKLKLWNTMPMLEREAAMSRSGNRWRRPPEMTR